MTNDRPIDYEGIRRRFPWVGLVNTGERNLSTRYREMMAGSHDDRERGHRVIPGERTP